jgi:hypothetical protein
MVGRRCEIVATRDVSVGEGDVTADHVKGRVTQDLLEAEHVATIDQVIAGKSVAEGVRRAAPFEAGSRLQALEDLLDAVVGKSGA